jgi:predicted ATPase
MRTLETLTIRNFKSIRDQTLKLGPLNVFIGGNGSGKSNLIEVFRLLRAIVDEKLAEYTAIKGGADTLLYFGRKQSASMMINVTFADLETSDGYIVYLVGTQNDGLAIGTEPAFEGEKRKADMESFRVYHFHDTSDTAAMKGTSDVDDNRFLRPQAENLAAFLYWLQEMRPEYMANIQDAIRQIAPFFDEFVLAPSRLNPSKIRLEWREKGSDMYFNASSLSDGTLRFICLATLLLQPDLPPLILLDEPELGLHPAAVTLLASLLSSASTRTQILVATQSVTLVNQFEPEQVWAVDREDRQSVFRHLSRADMSGWLDDYALGELWEKNVLGARP